MQMFHNINVQVSKFAMRSMRSLITNFASEEDITYVKPLQMFQILAKMAETDVPEIELIIKASTIDGKRKGACIFCQVNCLIIPN